MSQLVEVALTVEQQQKLREKLLAVRTAEEQTAAALLLFQRSDNINPFVALKAALSQIKEQHGLTSKQLQRIVKDCIDE